MANALIENETTAVRQAAWYTKEPPEMAQINRYIGQERASMDPLGES